MKNRISILLAALFISFFLSACGSDGSGELKSIMSSQADIIENFVNGLEKAQSPEDMVAAIENYTTGMKVLIPKLQKFQKEFPDYEKGVVPKDLEEDMRRVESASNKLSAAMMSSAQYMMDPRVQAAMSKMAEEIGALE